MEGAFTVVEAEEDNKTDVNQEKKTDVNQEKQNPPIEAKSFEAEDTMNLKDQGTTKKSANKLRKL